MAALLLYESDRQARKRGGLTPRGTLREALRAAREVMRGHKLRTFLTLAGVVISTSTSRSYP
jgi:hypothetical protein